jgi:hypothetical protein
MLVPKLGRRFVREDKGSELLKGCPRYTVFSCVAADLGAGPQ